MTDRSNNGAPTSDNASAVRIAYTINNDQPVRCTFISDEPLFYIDAPMTEEEMLEMHELGLIDDELLDAAISDHSGLPVAAQAADINPELLFQEQFSEVLVSHTTLAETLTLLRNSRLATSLLDFANEQGVTISMRDQMEPIFYDRMQGTITLRPQLSVVNQVLLLVRELRRVWQHRQGALIHPLLFHPDHAIVINRVQAADLVTMTIRVAWELRLAGHDAIWNDLDHGRYHDLTRAFGREAHADFRALNNGRAAAAAFETWFLSERCRSFDRLLIQQMLADYQSYVFRAGHEETSRVLTQQLVAALGAMPYGKNYLANYAATILADPIFTDIRDRSNANFLWFIKFEQSFRATERDLQPEGSISSMSPLEAGSHAQNKSATILNLPHRPGVEQEARAAAGAAVIVDLEQWRRRSNGD